MTERVGGGITDVVVGGDAGVERWLICCMLRVLFIVRLSLPLAPVCLGMHPHVYGPMSVCE